MAEVGSRDRLVMAGLVVLGLLTVVAGVLSGHSTIDYVLGRDANEAALSWARQIDTALGGTAETPGRVLDKDFQVLDPASFQENLASMAGKPASLPANQSFSQRGFGLIEAIDRLTGGWALGRSNQLKDDFVSKLDGFAVLNADEKPIATAGNLTSGKLASLFALGNVRDTLAESKQDDAVKVTSTDEAGDARVAFVPVVQDGKLSRIYAFSLDQSSAAALTNVALTGGRRDRGPGGDAEEMGLRPGTGLLLRQARRGRARIGGSLEGPAARRLRTPSAPFSDPRVGRDQPAP